MRLRPEHPNHVWSYDFVEDRTYDCSKYWMLKAVDVIDVLSDLFVLRGVPEHVHSDNGPASIAQALRDWLAAVGDKTAYIMPGRPLENRYCGSFDSKLRGEFLNGEIFYTLKEAKIVIDA